MDERRIPRLQDRRFSAVSRMSISQDWKYDGMDVGNADQSCGYSTDIMDY